MNEMLRLDPTLGELEAVIERGLTTFVEVGGALLEIRDRQLYQKDGYTEFDVYCRERWGWHRAHAYRLMDASRVAASLSPMGDKPVNERQARELARLPEPSAIQEVWSNVRERHGEKVTAADVREAVDEYVERKEHAEQREKIGRVTAEGETILTLVGDPEGRAARARLAAGWARLSVTIREHLLTTEPGELLDVLDIEGVRRAQSLAEEMSIWLAAFKRALGRGVHLVGDSNAEA